MLPAPRVPDGLTISSAPFREQPENEAPKDLIPDNGKAERFIQTALREWAYAHAYHNSNQRSAELIPWLHRYNWRRPHGSLKANTPISRLGLSEDNLLRLHS